MQRSRYALGKAPGRTAKGFVEFLCCKACRVDEVGAFEIRPTEVGASEMHPVEESD